MNSIEVNKGEAVLKLAFTSSSTYKITCVANPLKDYTDPEQEMDIDNPDFEMGIVMAGLIHMLQEDMGTLIEHGINFIESGQGPYTQLLSSSLDFDLLTEEQLDLYRMETKGEA